MWWRETLATIKLRVFRLAASKNVSCRLQLSDHVTYTRSANWKQNNLPYLCHLWMFNYGEIICFCVRFTCFFSSSSSSLVCVHVLHTFAFLVSVIPLCVSVLARFACCSSNEYLFFSLIFHMLIVSLVSGAYIFDVVEGDLRASFIIGSANTKLDIKIDATNDQ